MAKAALSVRRVGWDLSVPITSSCVDLLAMVFKNALDFIMALSPLSKDAKWLSTPTSKQQRTPPVVESKNQDAEDTSMDEDEETKGRRHSDTEIVREELIEISLATEVKILTATEIELVDELMELAKVGNLRAFQHVCQGLHMRNVRADAAGYMGWTPAHWAAREGHLHILEYLRSQHMNLDALDRKGDCLLHKAAANGQYRTCQWLLREGFNVQAKNNNGHTPLDVAREHRAIARTSEAALCEAILAREFANTF